ncbi:hypothetical protein H1R20_g363, partial [Candolleomyces eurysporus]
MAVVSAILDVPYSSAHPLLQFDYYCVKGNGDAQPLLVFVHGGAWRSEDKKDHAEFAQRLAAATKYPVVVPNYRLTSKTRVEHMFRHPGHTEDILGFLNFLGDWVTPPELEASFDPREIYLIGHSCSAHMLASIFLDSTHITPSLTPPAQLLEAVKGIVLSEGIYDIDRLLSTFPPYRDWFIEDAFGARESYEPFDVNHYRLRDAGKSPSSWLILHSKADTLIDIPQSQLMYDHLKKVHEGNTGSIIVRDFDTLKDEHDEILRGDEYVKLVQGFVSRVRGLTPQAQGLLPK